MFPFVVQTLVCGACRKPWAKGQTGLRSPAGRPAGASLRLCQSLFSLTKSGSLGAGAGIYYNTSPGSLHIDREFCENARSLDNSFVGGMRCGRRGMASALLADAHALGLRPRACHQLKTN